MKFYPIALVVLLFSFVGGCKKEVADPTPHTVVRGRVVDVTTGQPVAGARVYLLAAPKGSTGSSGSTPTRQTYVTSDAAGAYDLEFDPLANTRYELQATAPGFYDTPSSEWAFLHIGQGQDNRPDVPLRPQAWLRVRFLSQTPNVMTGVYLSRPFSVPYGIGGANVDTTTIGFCPGNVRNIIQWVRNPNNGSPSYYVSDSIFCPAHDTTDFVIRF